MATVTFDGLLYNFVFIWRGDQLPQASRVTESKISSTITVIGALAGTRMSWNMQQVAIVRDKNVDLTFSIEYLAGNPSFPGTWVFTYTFVDAEAESAAVGNLFATPQVEP